MNTNFLDPSLDPLLSSSSTPPKPGTHGMWNNSQMLYHMTVIFLLIKPLKCFSLASFAFLKSDFIKV